MLHLLKNHPFAVEAFFESSLVLAFAVPKEELASFIPECLELDTFEDKWAFIAVAMVQTKALRPKGLPAFLGNDFFLIGYRVFVRYTNAQGKKRRGLYILKSETDKFKMQFFGNVFTHYHYSTTDIRHQDMGAEMEIISKKSRLNIKVNIENEDCLLPENTPFPNWNEARKFAGPLPYTFTFNADKQEVLIIEGVRQNWKPKPVEVLHQEIGFLQDLAMKQAVLANAFIIQQIPYHWKKGVIEKWNP